MSSVFTLYLPLAPESRDLLGRSLFLFRLLVHRPNNPAPNREIVRFILIALLLAVAREEIHAGLGFLFAVLLDQLMGFGVGEEDILEFSPLLLWFLRGRLRSRRRRSPLPF